MTEIHEQLPVLSWKTDSMAEAIRWTAERIDEERGKRLVEHERAYRPGAKLDDTDWKANRWKITSCFNNTLQEDGLGDTPVMYPDRLNALLRSFDAKETGDLTLPTRGIRRCRAAWYRRSEEIGGNDEANCEFLFVEDSEDVLNLDSLADPQVNATIVRLAQQTVFSAERLGALDDGLVDLVVWASQMETLIAAPGRYVDDIKAQGNRNRRALKRVLAAEQQMAARNDLPWLRPEGHEPQRLVRRLIDLQARAIGEKKASRPPTRLYKVEAYCTLFDVAADVEQDAQALMELNQDRVDDPLDLQPGDRVEVFA